MSPLLMRVGPCQGVDSGSSVPVSQFRDENSDLKNWWGSLYLSSREGAWVTAQTKPEQTQIYGI